MTANDLNPGVAANDTLSGQIQYVTVFIGGQLFGLPIHKVHDVFVPESMTRVPLSANEIAGVLNLRGRIVIVAPTAAPDQQDKVCLASPRFRERRVGAHPF